MSQLKSISVLYFLLISNVLIGQTFISSNTIVTPSNYDENGYVVKSGTLTFDISASSIFEFTEDASVHVLTGARVSILGGHFSPKKTTWKGFILDGVEFDNYYALSIESRTSVSIFGAEVGVHCKPILSNDLIGKAANINVKPLLNNQINFQNVHKDIFIENINYVENKSNIKSFDNIDVHFYGANGCHIKNTQLINTLEFIEFTSNQRGIVFENSSAKVQNSKFNNLQNGIVVNMSMNQDGIELFNNTFEHYNTGVHINESNTLFISSCIFKSGQTGVSSTESESISLYQNKFEDNLKAIQFDNSNEIHIYTNLFINDINGLIIKNCSEINLYDNSIENITNRSYLGISNENVMMVDNEFKNCSTTEHTVKIEHSNNLYFWSCSFIFDVAEISTNEHSALHLTSTSNVKLLRNYFENYKFNDIYITGGSEIYNFKTCLNTFKGNTDIAIKIDGDVIDQGNSIVPSHNKFYLDFSSGNKTVESLTSIIFYQPNVSPISTYSTNSSLTANFLYSSGNQSDCEPDLPLTISSSFGYKLSEPSNSIPSSNISIYPNPIIKTFTMEGEMIDFTKKITVVNVLGQQMDFVQSHSNIDISTLPKGQYVLSIPLKSGEISIQKIIKQ